MTLGFEHREQVYFLGGLILFAGYVMYSSRPSRTHAPKPPHPSTPRRGDKAIGCYDVRKQIAERLPGAWL